MIPANTSFMVRAANNGSTLNFTENVKGTGEEYTELRQFGAEFLRLNIYDSNYHLWDELATELNAADTDDDDDAIYDCGMTVNPVLNFYSWTIDHHALSNDSLPFEPGKVISLGKSSVYMQDFIIRAHQF